MADGAPSLDTVLTAMLAELSPLLPPPQGQLPVPSVTVVSAVPRNPAIGARLGTEHRAGFPVAALKGGQIAGMVRFQLWAANPTDVDGAVDALHATVLAEAENLRVSGFLKLEAEDTTLAEPVTDLNAWRKAALYSLLYEYRYLDSDEAEALIVRIAIAADREHRDSPERETTVVTDEMVRWDDEQAPTLTVRAGTGAGVRVGGLGVIAHTPAAWAGDPVVIERLRADAPIAPTDYATLDAFLDAVTDPDGPDTHARVTLASVADLLAALDPAGDPFELGDWGGGGADQYQPLERSFHPPIVLAGSDDLFRLAYQQPALDSTAVIYLRARVARAGTT
jgi:hypothetical protein